MSRLEKLRDRLQNPGQDANWNFQDLVSLLQNLGWEMRIRGSHHFFRKAGVQEVINLQPSGFKAKNYQVRQVRSVLTSTGDL